jgi:hypothetical protein
VSAYARTSTRAEAWNLIRRLPFGRARTFVFFRFIIGELDALKIAAFLPSSEHETDEPTLRFIASHWSDEPSR